MNRLGVLLMTYGSPDSLDDMPRYLAAVRGGREADPELVTEFKRRYALIGGSPLIPITQEQAAALEQRLGEGARVEVGMRFSEPSVTAGMRRLTDDGCDRVVGIIMSPQYSELLMNGYRRALEAARKEIGDAAPAVILAPAWYGDGHFVAAVAQRIREGLTDLPEGAPVLLTAHSLPRRVADAEPAYLDQLRETAVSVAAAAGLSDERWHFCWQSAGHEPGEWMKPDFADLVPELRAAGHTAVLVAPIQFLADHLEILYDVDIGAREQAETAEMAFARIESLNVMPEFIDALAGVALSAGSGG
jgi:protoporphyrin/coproporphyrin ferrochelatase